MRVFMLLAESGTENTDKTLDLRRASMDRTVTIFPGRQTVAADVWIGLAADPADVDHVVLRLDAFAPGGVPFGRESEMWKVVVPPNGVEYLSRMFRSELTPGRYELVLSVNGKPETSCVLRVLDGRTS